MLPAFFELKLQNWDTLENETMALFVRLRTSPLSFSFMSENYRFWKADIGGVL